MRESKTTDRVFEQRRRHQRFPHHSFEKDDDESQPLMKQESDIKSENVDALLKERIERSRISYSQKM